MKTARKAPTCTSITTDQVTKALRIIESIAEDIGQDFETRLEVKAEDQWDATLALLEAQNETDPSVPQTAAQKRQVRERLMKEADINSSVLTREVVAELRNATRHPDAPGARDSLSRAASNANSVELTMGYTSLIGPSLKWIVNHPTDPRCRCIVDLLVLRRDQSAAAVSRIRSSKRAEE